MRYPIPSSLLCGNTRLSGLLMMTLLALCFCPPPPARAMLIQRSGDVRVAALSPEDWQLSCPDLAVGADGAAVVIWGRTFWGYPQGVVLARRVEPDGELGPLIQISDEHVEQPGVVAIESGGYVAHWTGGSTNAYRPSGTVVQFLDPYGSPTGAARLVEGFDAQVAAVGDQLALVAKRRPRAGLLLRLLDRQGGDAYPPRQLAAGETFGHAVASDGAGGVVAAWAVLRKFRLELMAQAFDGAGQPRSEPIVVARLQHYIVSPPRVAVEAGRFVVGWSQVIPPAVQPTVQLRIFTLAGELVGRSSLALERALLYGRPFLSDLAASPQGVTVVWDRDLLDRYQIMDVFAAEFDWEGKSTEPTRSLPADRAHDQQCGRLASNGKGDWAAAWHEFSTTAQFMTRIEARTFRDP
jgi:hypothetical protein